MSDQKTVTEISICLGSSCFSRGNNKSLRLIQQYIEENNLEDKVHIKGKLCQGQCKNGPNLNINGQVFNHLEPITVIDILNHSLKKGE